MTAEEKPAGMLHRWAERKKQAAAESSDAVLDNTRDFDTPTEVLTGIEYGIPTASVSLQPLEAEPRADARQPDENQWDLEASALLAADSAEESLLNDDDMPAIETLTASSDVSMFLNKGVSAALRKAALRYVFQQPQFNLRDGLNDYDGDYTAFEPLGDTITADMKFHAARKARDKLAAEEEALRVERESSLMASHDEAVESPESASEPALESETPEAEVEQQNIAIAGSDGEVNIDQQTAHFSETSKSQPEAERVEATPQIPPSDSTV